MLAAVPGCVGWLAGVEPVSKAVIAAADRMQVISRNGTGVDNLPMEAISAAGIAVRRAEGTNARGVAELALALILAGLRDLIPTHIGLKAGAWPRRIGTEIQGAEIAVIGLGAIGRALAGFCLALGANVRGFDPFAPADVILHPAFARMDFSEAIKGAMVVSLHAPMQSDGRALLGAAQLASLARGAVLVNTAREGLVDPQAVLAALQSGQLGTYATDAFDSEPPVMTPLLHHPQVITTSHIGGFTGASVERSTQRAVENLLEALATHAD